MIVQRWQGDKTLSIDEIKSCYQIKSDQDFVEETIAAGQAFKEHYHTFLEIRIICQGELLCKIAGNQILLRPGDRIEIPANTKHSYVNNYKSDCVSLVGYYSF